MIEINNLNLALGKYKILKNISCDFSSGMIHGIVGRNGSGKTMLMKCICGFVHPTSGTIFVGGKQIGKDLEFPSDTGLLIETPSFIPYYTGYKNLMLLAGINNIANKEQVKECMEIVGLSWEGDKKVSKYSLGMRQRLGIAQAIMENPSVLILDEPMNGLDRSGLYEMRELFLKMKKEGKTILLSSHNSEDIDLLCDSVIQIDSGELV